MKEFFMSVEDVQTKGGEEYAQDMNNTVVIIGEGRATNNEKPCIAFECVHSGQRFRISVSAFVKAVKNRVGKQLYFFTEDRDGKPWWSYDSQVEFHLQVKNWRPTISAPRDEAVKTEEVAELTTEQKLAKLAALEAKEV